MNPSRSLRLDGLLRRRYSLAVLSVVSALVLIGLGEAIFGSTALLLLAVAIITVSRFAGIAGAIFSVLLSTLAGDFFFLPPIFSFNFDQSTWVLCAKYSVIAALSYLIFRQRRSQRVLVRKRSLGLVGHIGEMRDGELYGWAIDTDDPERPVRVTAHVNGRPSAEALAVYYRPDIANRFHSSGRSGFYLDLTQRSAMVSDAIVDVRLPNGKYLEGAPIRAHLPGRPGIQSCTLLFMHIPKTAGTALRETMLNNYRQSEVAYLYPDPPGFPVRDLRDLPLEQRARFRFVVGHFQYGIHDQVPNESCYFAVVRDPLARVCSHYHYLVHHQHPLVLSQGRIRTLREVIEGRFTANLDNLMVRCFAGVDERDFPPGSINTEVYELALRHAEEAFIYIGHQQNLREAYSFLQDKFRWPWSMPPEVLNRGSYATDQPIADSDAELIRESNSWDCQLYGRVLDMFPYRTPLSSKPAQF